MKFWPEVHWSEGQFLRPHHLQAAYRQAETARAAALRGLCPYDWGFVALDLAEEAVQNGELEIRACELRLSDGSHIKVPENCTIPAREFKQKLEQAAGPLDVYVGVPEVQAVRANVQAPGEDVEGRPVRYTIDLTERYDENTGENPQPVEVRRMRGAVFVGAEDRAGYTCVRLGRLERSAAGPKLVREVLPPLLRLQAWPALCAEVERLWHDIRDRMEQLGADAAARGLTFATASAGDLEQLLKLLALNELAAQFGVLASAPELHPHALYVALCTGVGKVALWDDTRRLGETPEYDHGDCGAALYELSDRLRTLVDRMIPRDYEERLFEVREGGYVVDLDYEWLTPNHELYLGIRGPKQLQEVEQLLGGLNFKIASPRDVKALFEGRLRGLERQYAGPVPGLPQSHDQFYFRISRTPPYWANCERDRGIAIRMPPQDMPKLGALRLSLFVKRLKG
jgi:type VI secretion system protein ImpJ